MILCCIYCITVHIQKGKVVIKIIHSKQSNIMKYFPSVFITCYLWIFGASSYNVSLPLDRNSQHVFHHHNLAATTNLKIGFFQASAEQTEIRKDSSLSSRLSSSHFPQTDLGDLWLIIRTDGYLVSHSGGGPGPVTED